MKKIISLVLCLAILASFSLVSFAATKSEDMPVEDAPSLTFKCVSISTETKIRMCAAVSVSVLDEYDDYYVEFKNLDSKDNRMVLNETDHGFAYGQDNSLIVFDFPIYVCQMTEHIEATLYGVKDTKLFKGESISLSVEEAIYHIMDSLTADRQKLAVNLLEYGAKMQEVLGYRTDCLANANLGELEALVDRSIPVAEDSFAVLTDEGLNAVSLYKRALGVNSVMELQYMFLMNDIEKDDVYVTLTVDGETTIFDGSTLKSARVTVDGEKQNIAILVFSDLLPTQGDEEIQIAAYLKKDNSRVSEIYSDTLASFVNGFQKSNDTKLVDAVNAMLNYYRLAKSVYVTPDQPEDPIGDKPTIMVNNASMNADEKEVAVTISLVNNPGISSLKLFVDYDDRLTLTKVSYNTADFGNYVTAPEPFTNPQAISLVSPLDDVTGNGLFATLTFSVHGSIKAGTKLPIQLTYDADNTFNADFDEVVFQTIDGFVTIESGSTEDPTEPTEPEDPIGSDPAIVVNNAAVSSGETTVSVTISMVNNPGISSLKLFVSYDERLTLAKVTYNTAEFGNYVTAPEPFSNPQAISLMSPLDDVTGNGLFATLTFNIQSGVAVGTKLPIHLTYDADNTFNADFDEVVFRTIDGVVTVN